MKCFSLDSRFFKISRRKRMQPILQTTHITAIINEFDYHDLCTSKREKGRPPILFAKQHKCKHIARVKYEIKYIMKYET